MTVLKMAISPMIECDVTFLSPEEGGRQAMPVLSGNVYRPLLVVGDPNQRLAKVESGVVEVECADGSHRKIRTDKFLSEEHLAVLFSAGSDLSVFGESAIVSLGLFSSDNLEKLKPGTTFTIREGSKIVGFGKVRNWLI